MAAARKIPMRKCVGCGEMKPKKELMRILRTQDGEEDTTDEYDPEDEAEIEFVETDEEK